MPSEQGWAAPSDKCVCPARDRLDCAARRYETDRDDEIESGGCPCACHDDYEGDVDEDSPPDEPTAQTEPPAAQTALPPLRDSAPPAVGLGPDRAMTPGATQPDESERRAVELPRKEHLDQPEAQGPLTGYVDRTIRMPKELEDELLDAAARKAEAQGAVAWGRLTPFAKVVGAATTSRAVMEDWKACGETVVPLYAHPSRTEPGGCLRSEELLNLLRRYRDAHRSMALVGQEAGAAEAYRDVTKEVDDALSIV